MLLGELFYYNKKLDEITFPIDQSKLKDIALMGVESFNSKEVEGLSTFELQRAVRDKFTSSFLDVLKQHNSRFIFTFWTNLISSLKDGENNSEFRVLPETDFQKKILAWANQNFDLDSLEDLLKEAQYSVNENDFILYYGLKVVSKLTIAREKNIYETTSKSELINVKETTHDFSAASLNPQIIVVTTDYLSPLFININALCAPIAIDNKETLANVEKLLAENPEVKTILVNTSSEKIVDFLKKHLSNTLFIAQLNLDSDESDNFFDKITKKTLGIKLTIEE